MTKKLPILLLLAAMCLLVVSNSLFAKSKYDQNTQQIIAQRTSKIAQYALPRTDRKPVKAEFMSLRDELARQQAIQRGAGRTLSSLGTASPSASPGINVRASYNDWQYSTSTVRVDYLDSSLGTSPIIHFAYEDRSSGSDVAPSGYGYNMYDPSAGSWPKGLDIGRRVQATDFRGARNNLAVYPNGKVVLAGYEGSGTGNLENHLYSNPTANSCNWFSGSAIPDSIYKQGFMDTTIVNDWLAVPKVRMQVIGTDTVTHVLAVEAAGFYVPASGVDSLFVSPLLYFRRVGTDPMGITTSWSNPVVIDSVGYFGALAVSPVSSKVAVAYFLYTATGLAHGNFSDKDVFYRESLDGGLTWGSKVNITNYDRTQKSYAPWVEQYAMYDTQDNLHILWNANPYPPNVYDSASFFFNDFSCSLFHWSNSTGAVSRVANRDYGLEWNTQVCGMGGANALYLAFFAMSECNGKLYVTYSGWNDVFGDGTIDDCASSFGTAPSRVYQANGEIYMQVSSTIDGLLWDAPENITNSPTPGCDSLLGGGICDNDTKL